MTTATGEACATLPQQKLSHDGNSGHENPGDESEREPWDDWMPEVQTALDVILRAEADKQAAVMHTVDDGEDDDWNPTEQLAAQAASAGGDEDDDDDDDWAPDVQGAANVEQTEQEALRRLLKPTHLVEREKQMAQYETKREADVAGRMLQELKRPPSWQEAKEEIKAAATANPHLDIDALPQPSQVDMTETEAIAMVQKGATVNLRGQHDRTPLHKAAEMAHPLLCKALCDAGGSLDARDKYGETPLLFMAHAASEHEDIAAERRRETIQMLLSLGADVHAVNPRGRGVLHLASAENDDIMMQTCIEGMADVNSQDLAGFTPLMWAAGRNGVKSVQMLLDIKADANVKAARGQTALTFALTNGNDEIVDILEKRQMLLDRHEVRRLDGVEVTEESAARPKQLPRPEWACKKQPPAQAQPYGGRVYKDAKPDRHSNVYS